jgi:hypothetical protein
MVFWGVTPCGLVGGYQRLGVTCRFHVQGKVYYEAILLVKGSRGSSVSIVSGYGRDDRGSIPNRGRGLLL